METKSIKQTVTLPGTPTQVYTLLMDAKKHAAFTEADAYMDKKINGKFSTYDGYIHGYNMELEKNIKIKQAWHFAEDGWPEDHFSVCTFRFEAVANGTKIHFHQSGVPGHKVEALKKGWKKYYWQPMKEFLKK